MTRFTRTIEKLVGRFTHYPSPLINPHCSEFEVNNWVLSGFVLEQLVPVVGVQPFPLNELVLMSGALVRFQPEHLFEWGTHIGKSARIFYETSRAFRIQCTIHTIDLPEDSVHIEHPGRQYGKLIRHLPKIQKYRGDGLEVSFRVARSLPVVTRLMFFLDGDHSYASVHRELDAIIQAFPRACILLHDTFFQSANSGYNVGPRLTIEAALKTNEEKYQVIHTDTGLPGMTLLYPRT